jgi:protein subunit release factor A
LTRYKKAYKYVRKSFKHIKNYDNLEHLINDFKKYKNKQKYNKHLQEILNLIKDDNLKKLLLN